MTPLTTRFSLAATAALALLMPAGATSEPALHICYEDQPWGNSYLGHGTEVPDENPGIMIELIERAAERVQLETRYSRMPWKRCLLLISRSEVDAIVAASFTEDRAAHSKYPRKADGRVDLDRALAINSQHLYTYPGSNITWNGSAVSGYDGAVAYVNGYVVGELISKRYKLEGYPMPTPEDAIRIVARKRLGLLAASTGTEETFIAGGPFELTRLSPPLNVEGSFLSISNAYYGLAEEQVEALWTAIGQVRQQEGPRIASRYR